MRPNRIVPLRTHLMILNSERCHRGIRHFLPFGGTRCGQVGADPQARLGGGGVQVAHHLVKGTHGAPGPGFADFTEQAVLDRVPFGRAWGIMAYCHRPSQGIRHLDLQVIFPRPRPCSIAAASISNDQQMVGIRIALPQIGGTPARYWQPQKQAYLPMVQHTRSHNYAAYRRCHRAPPRPQPHAENRACSPLRPPGTRDAPRS